MSEEKPADIQISYQCVWCGRIFEKGKLSRVAETRCPYCGFNVIKKTRGGTAKLIESSKLPS